MLGLQEKRKPPKPTADDVYRFCTPSGKVFVANFSGLALEGTVLQQAKALADNLKRYAPDCLYDLHFMEYQLAFFWSSLHGSQRPSADFFVHVPYLLHSRNYFAYC